MTQRNRISVLGNPNEFMNATPRFLLSEKIYFFSGNPSPLSAILDFPHTLQCPRERSKLLSKLECQIVLDIIRTLLQSM